MDDRRFDAFTRGLGQGASRRALLKGLLGIGGVATAGAVLHDAEAARRGYTGPPTFGPSPTATAPSVPTPTNTSVPATRTPTPTPTITPNPCGPSGVCCSSDDDCRAIPTYCESTQQYPLLWRYYLCSSPGVCELTAHVCANAGHNCEIDVCGDQTDCAVVDVQPGQMGSQGAVCCTEDNHCGGLPRYCDGDDWHYFACISERCEERLTHCAAGQCHEPIGCQIIGP